MQVLRPTYRVLVVEHDLDRALRTRGALSASRGFQVTHSRSGGQALDASSRDAFQACLIGEGLPDIDGVALCREMRRRAFFAPILLVAPPGGERMAREAFDAGADDVLARSDDLADRVAETLLAHLGGTPA